MRLDSVHAQFQAVEAAREVAELENRRKSLHSDMSDLKGMLNDRVTWGDELSAGGAGGGGAGGGAGAGAGAGVGFRGAASQPPSTDELQSKLTQVAARRRSSIMRHKQGYRRRGSFSVPLAGDDGF